MPIQTDRIDVAAPAGKMPAFVATPEGRGPHPAVVVLMEAFGLVEHIEEVSRRLAGQGYLAIAPDVYYRELPDNKVGYDELPRAIELMQKVDDGAFVEDMRALFAELEARDDVDPSRVGVTGFCMGGRLAFLTACELADRVSAAAPFYGGGIAGLLEKADAIRAPLYLFFGERDLFIPPEQVQAIDDRLKALGKTYSLQCYEGADHGFFCDKRESYDAKAAASAWSELLGFFKENV